MDNAPLALQELHTIMQEMANEKAERLYSNMMHELVTKAAEDAFSDYFQTVFGLLKGKLKNNFYVKIEKVLAEIAHN